MYLLSFEESRAISGGELKNAGECKSDIEFGSGLVGTLGGALGAAFGPAGAFVGAAAGAAIGGALAAHYSASCQPVAAGNLSDPSNNTVKQK
ncbi:hypothetical protein [Mizugakiibacter sediminis]|nr:hypothetical protein [Mizugakiibacter sediminis]